MIFPRHERQLIKWLLDVQEHLDSMRDCLTHWLTKPDMQDMAYWLEWQKLIEQGIEAVISLALEPTERGQVMRSCSPFGVLWRSPTGRWEFIEVWRSKRRQQTKLEKVE